MGIYKRFRIYKLYIWQYQQRRCFYKTKVYWVNQYDGVCYLRTKTKEEFVRGVYQMQASRIRWYDISLALAEQNCKSPCCERALNVQTENASTISIVCLRAQPPPLTIIAKLRVFQTQ